jgi:hypothetical protein
MAFGPLLAFQRCADYKGDKGLPMGRILVTTLIVSACLLPSLTQAQTSSPSRGTVAPAPPTGGVPRGGSFGVTTRQNPPPPPSPPPHAGPVVPPAPPSALDRADIFGATPRTYAPRFDRVSRRDRFFGYSGGYITDPFGYISQPDSSSPALDRYMRNEQGTGYLRLEVEPDTAQVYVDDLYAGTVADFRRGGRALDVGPHRVDIRADGYEPQGVELRIRSNDTLSYRGTLTRRDDRAEVQRTAAATPKTFYVIPRCYAGTSRPRAEQLPPGCRISDVRTVPPVVEPSRRQ